MGQRRSKLGIGGCIIPVIAVVLSTLFLLLESGVLFFAISILAISLYFWNKFEESKQTKNQDNYAEDSLLNLNKLKTEELVLEKKNSVNDFDHVEFLENIVNDLDENSTLEIDIKPNGQIKIYGLLFYKNSSHLNYKREGEFTDLNEAISYLKEKQGQ